MINDKNGLKEGYLPPEISNLGFYLDLPVLKRWEEEGKIEYLNKVNDVSIQKIPATFSGRSNLRKIRLLASIEGKPRKVVDIFGKFYDSEKRIPSWRMKLDESIKYQYNQLAFWKRCRINLHEPIHHVESQVILNENGKDPINTVGLLSEYLPGFPNDINILALKEGINERKRFLEEKFIEKKERSQIESEIKELQNTIYEVTTSVFEKMNLLMHRGTLNLNLLEGQIYNPSIEYHQKRLQESIEYLVLWSRGLNEKISLDEVHNILREDDRKIIPPLFMENINGLIKLFEEEKKYVIHGDEHYDNFKGYIDEKGNPSSEVVDSANAMMGPYFWGLAKLLTSPLTGYGLEEILWISDNAIRDFERLKREKPIEFKISRGNSYTLLFYELICAMSRQAENELTYRRESSDDNIKRNIPYNPKFLEVLNPKIKEIELPEVVILKEGYNIKKCMENLKIIYNEFMTSLSPEKGVSQEVIKGMKYINKIFEKEQVLLN